MFNARTFIKALFLTLLVLGGSLVVAPTVVQAQLRNPAISDELGNNPAGATSGTIFISYLVTIWRAVIVVGGLMLLLYLVWGAIEWITAAGDSGKVGKARDKMTQAVIGMIILVASFTIVGFISSTFFGGQFNLLNPVIPTPAGGFGPGSGNTSIIQGTGSPATGNTTGAPNSGGSKKP